MRDILSIENVSLTYQAENGEVHALDRVSLSAQEGELIAIVGPSGCGKSTLLSAIAGLTPPTSGRVVIAGEEVRGVSKQIGYMLQKDSLLDWRTIRSNVLLGLEIRKTLTPENIAHADRLLEMYGLGEFRSKYPAQLSGGMRQRAALIRTLAARPELLLLDEAFSALDYQTRLSVTDDVFRILKREKKTALIVTHDIPEAIPGKTHSRRVKQREPGECAVRHIPPVWQKEAHRRSHGPPMSERIYLSSRDSTQTPKRSLLYRSISSKMIGSTWGKMLPGPP